MEATPFATAYLSRRGTGWASMSWAEVGRRVRLLSAGLRTLGVGGSGAVLSSTRVEWLLADFALMTAGLPTTTIYPSSTAATTRFILEDAGVGVVFVEDATQLAKLLQRWPNGLAHAVLIDGESVDPRVLSWSELLRRGQVWLQRHGEGWWREQALEAQQEDLATLIYTSGTTGRPKGVELTHGNWLAQAEASNDLMTRFGAAGDSLYLWLPLAHAYGKVLQLAGVATGTTTIVDGDPAHIPAVLAELSPAWVPVVPRVFEKMHIRLVQRAAERGPRAARVVTWALKVAQERSRAAAPSRRLRLQHALADRLVFRKVRAAMGGRIRGFLCGSAPLSVDLEHLFCGMGLPVLQGYGLTECGAVATANLPDDLHPGTVGRAHEGMQVRIVEGEVQLRGRSVMRGYHNLPEQTAAVFDKGWFCTGDLGSLNNGVLTITGRAKEILITAGGKNIAPAPIESALKACCGLLQEVVLLGDGRPTCMALITLDPEAAASWASRHNTAVDGPALEFEVRTAVDQLNTTLASFETIKDFVILDAPFSIASGELTPSQKVRRAVVIERYAALIEQLYQRAGS